MTTSQANQPPAEELEGSARGRVWALRIGGQFVVPHGYSLFPWCWHHRNRPFFLAEFFGDRDFNHCSHAEGELAGRLKLAIAGQCCHSASSRRAARDNGHPIAIEQLISP